MGVIIIIIIVFIYLFFIIVIHLKRGRERLETVRCGQASPLPLITLLAGSEVQLWPWEGNYSHDV